MIKIKRVVAGVVCLSMIIGVGCKFCFMNKIKANADEINTNIVNDIFNENLNEVEQTIEVNEKELPVVGQQVYSYNENGIDYNVTVSDDGVNQFTQTIDVEGKTRVDVIFKNNKEIMEVNEYKKINVDADNNIVYNVVSKECINLAEQTKKIEANMGDFGIDNLPITRAKRYNKSVHDEADRRYYYAFGQDERNRKYIMIGCNKHYEIPYWNLGGGATTARVDRYVNKINKTRDLATRICVKMSLSELAGALAAYGSKGKAGLVAFLGCLVAGASACADNIIDLYNTHNDIKYIYEDIKTMGTPVAR